jgi:hypothetical protein
MSNQSMNSNEGYVCTVRGCKKTDRRFTLIGLCMHIRDEHGDDVLEKRLKTRVEKK